MRDGTKMAMLFPFLAVLIIAVFAGGIGVIFMVLESAVPDTWGVIVLGTALVVGVPATAALIQRRIERE